MASDIFFLCCTHFDHANILNFKDANGELMRGKIWSNVDEMNEGLIENWNSVVRKPTDKVYHLGDVTFKPNKFARIASRLNGHKRLLVGNHDDPKNFELTRWFEKVSLWRIFKEHNFVATHVPLPPDQFRYKVQYNVHGHLHQNIVRLPNDGGPYANAVDTRYINVCLEHTDYKPLHIEEVKKRFLYEKL